MTMDSRVTFGATTTSKRIAVAAQSVAPSDAVRVALVDDEPLIHTAVRHSFQALAPEWTLDDYMSGKEAVDGISKKPPRAVLMDVSMPEMTGIECTRWLKTLLPKLPIIMFTARDDRENVVAAVSAGASGYVLKPSSPAETVSAIKKVLEGWPALCMRSEKIIVEWLHRAGQNVFCWGLTAREQQVMQHVCCNRYDKEIAALLDISTSTVHGHLHSAYKKLGVKDRNQARRKFIGLDELAVWSSEFGGPGGEMDSGGGI